MYPLVNPIASAPNYGNIIQPISFNQTTLIIDDTGYPWLSYDGLTFTKGATSIFPATIVNPTIQLVTNGFLWIAYSGLTTWATSGGVSYYGYTMSSDGITWTYRDTKNNPVNLFNLPTTLKLQSAVGSYTSFIDTPVTSYMINSICWDSIQNVWLASIISASATVSTQYYIAVSQDAVTWSSLQEVPSITTAIGNIQVGNASVTVQNPPTSGARYLASSSSRVIISWTGSVISSTTDGISWGLQTLSQTIYMVTSNGTIWLALTNGYLYTSYDTTVWQLAGINTLLTVVWTGRIWVGWSSNGALYSYDTLASGASWQPAIQPPSGPGVYTSVSITYNGSYVTLWGYTSGDTVYSCKSPDGIYWGTWASTSITLSTGLSILPIATKTPLPYINVVPPGPRGPTGTSPQAMSIFTKTFKGSLTNPYTFSTITAGSEAAGMISYLGYNSGDSYMPMTFTSVTATYLVSVTVNYVTPATGTQTPVIFTIAKATSPSASGGSYFNLFYSSISGVGISSININQTQVRGANGSNALSISNGNYLACDNSPNNTAVSITMTTVDNIPDPSNLTFGYAVFALSPNGSFTVANTPGTYNSLNYTFTVMQLSP
jgi:hypothetical protein